MATAAQSKRRRKPGPPGPGPGAGSGLGPRAGPRPLPLHLVSALTTLTSSLAALPYARAGLLPWAPALAAAAANLRPALAAAPPEALAQAVGAAVHARLEAMVAGISAYQTHPYRRGLPDPPVLATLGTTRLLDYGRLLDFGAPGGAVVLVVPSLVNRHYVLDLTPERSLMRWLGGQGFRPLLVAWDAPGDAERGFSLTDYIDHRLAAMLAIARAEAGGGPVPVIGYCMGGNLALALALRRPEAVSALGLLATPWDFHAELSAQARLFAATTEAWSGVLEFLGELPVDVLQAFFAALDPNLAQRKFAAFARLKPKSARARHFVALEDWLNDGVPLAAPVALECLTEWYGTNSPARGAWRVGGQRIDPAEVACPVLAAIPEADRIVPPASALALAQAIPGAVQIRPPSGHIGMVVSGRAEPGLWRPLADWLARVKPS